MCESKVIIIEGGKRNIVMDAAATIKVDGDTIICTDITGESVEVKNVKVSEMNLLRHEILLERSR